MSQPTVVENNGIQRCRSCGVYGQYPNHFPSCSTRTGVRIVREVLEVRDWETDKNAAKTSGTYSWLWEG